MCSISCGLCPSSSARFAKRGRSKCKQQSTRSSLSVRLASTSQFFLLRPCQVVKVVHLKHFPLPTQISLEYLLREQSISILLYVFFFVGLRQRNIKELSSLVVNESLNYANNTFVWYYYTPNEYHNQTLYLFVSKGKVLIRLVERTQLSRESG